MAEIGKLVVKLTAITSEFERKMKGVTKTLDKHKQSIKTLGIASGAAFAAMAAGIAKAVQAADTQEKAERKLASAIAATGQAIDSQRIKDYAASLQQVTTFGDEASIEMAAMLTTFQLTEDQVMGLMPLVQDLAAFMDMDLQSAAVAVGKAVTGSAGALSRYGITLSDSQKAAFNAGTQTERVAILMEGLRKNVGGAAEALAGTPLGQYEQAMNALGDTMEEVGKIAGPMLLPIFETLESLAEKASAALANMDDDTRALVETLGAFAIAGAGITLALSSIAYAFPGVIAGFAAMGQKIAAVAKVVWGLKATLIEVAAIAAGAMGIVGAVKLMTGDDPEEGKRIRETYGIDPNAGMLDNFVPVLTAMIGEGIGTAMGPVVDGITKGLAGAASAAGDVPPAFDGAAGAVGNFGAAVGKAKDTTIDFGGAVDDGSDAMEQFAADLDRELNGIDFGGAEALLEDAAGKADDAMQELSDWITKVTDPARDLEKLASAMPDLLSFVSQTGGLTDSPMEALSAEADIAREELAASREHWVSTLDEGLEAFAGAIVGRMGEFGQIVQSAIQGFQAGGPWGAIIAVIAELLSRAPSWNKIVDQLNKFVFRLVQTAEPFLAMLEPLIGAVLDLLMTIIEFSNASSLLNQSFQVVGWVFEKLAWIINKITGGIRAVWNWIVEKLATFVGYFSKKWARRIRDAKMKDPNEAQAEPEPEPEDGLVDANDAAGDLADTFRDLNEAISNIPEGFRMAFRQYQAIDNYSAPGGPQQGTGAAPGVMEQTNNYYFDKLEAADPESFMRGLHELTRWEGIKNGGTSVNTAPAYSGG